MEELASFVFQRHRDLAGIAAFGIDGDLPGGALFDALEFVSPFHQDQRIGSEQFVEAQSLELPL